MRQITQINEDLNAQIVALKAIDPKDTEALENGMKALKDLEVELKAAKVAEDAERNYVRAHVEKEAAKGNSFSMVRFIKGVLENNLDGIEAEMAAAGAEEYRRNGLSQQGVVIPSAVLSRSADGQNYGTNGDGGYLIETTQHYVEDVKAKLVVNKMGASVLNNLIGNVSLPSAGSVTASFLNEAAEASTLKSTISRVVLTPRGIRANMVTTRDLLKQTSIDVERILMDRLSDAAAACIDKEALKAIGTAVTSASGTGLSWANVVAAETAINSASANRGSMGYVLTAAAWGAAKTTLKSANVGGYILDGNNMINGYAADYSNLMPSGVDAIFGNFQDLYIGLYGGLDLLVDPYSLGDKGEIKIQLFQYADAKVALAKSFAKIAGSGSGSGSGSGA